MGEKPATDRQLFSVHISVGMVVILLCATYWFVLRPTFEAVQRIESRCTQK